MNSRSLIIANWKCNPTTLREAEHLFSAVEKEVGKVKEAELVFCPPFIYLHSLIGAASGGLPSKDGPAVFGAQDCFWEEKGAYTGEVSPLMLKNLGCQYVIVGHSERRKNFSETDEMVNKKLKAALGARLKPILCLGEETRETTNAEGRPLSEMSLVVGDQLEKNLAEISSSRIRDVVIAYEPIWAIGTGNPCSPNDAMKAALFIRKTLAKLYDRLIAEKARVLYGGSVNSQNAASYVKGADMNGLLVGGASLNATEFVKIVQSVSH